MNRLARGWITVDRKIFESWVWNDKPFSKGQAWIDLILLANHEDKKFPFGNEVVLVKRGSFITSELKLMERWGWGKTRVRAFLKLLENDSMIVKNTNQKRTTITIVKYGDYQDLKTNNKPIINRKQTDSKPIAYTNNNDKQCITMNNKKDIAPPADENLPEGAERLSDGSVSYANVKREWD